MVPKSRLSIPLFAAFVLVLASYLAYVMVAKNIFRVPLLDQYFHPESTLSDGQSTTTNSFAWPFTFSKKGDVKIPREAAAKKIIVVNDKNSDETNAPGSEVNSTPEVAAAPTDRSESDSVDTGVVANVVSSAPTSREYELNLLWKKYSERVAPLYSAPLNKNTEEKVGRVAQLSADLDRRYIDDKTDWINRLEEVRTDLITIALEGEREGARALSFQYVRPPLSRTAEALTWAMIANAISPNDYYLYICADEFSICSEGLFDQASLQAKSYSEIYHFSPGAQSRYKK